MKYTVFEERGTERVESLPRIGELLDHVLIQSCTEMSGCAVSREIDMAYLLLLRSVRGNLAYVHIARHPYVRAAGLD